nr:hypothetical protein [uncultured Chryseobacterium sp.]
MNPRYPTKCFSAGKTEYIGYRNSGAPLGVIIVKLCPLEMMQMEEKKAIKNMTVRLLIL